MAPYQAVLFDFDGVLGRTDNDNYEAWMHIFRKFNLSIDRQEYSLMEGRRSREIIPYFLKKNNADPGLAETIITMKNEYYSKNNSFTLYPGVKDLVSTLKALEIKLALVSGGSACRILQPPSDEILPLFDVVLTGDDCTESKPSPKPYLTAAERLGVAPQNCLVIENAPLGIESAKKAGMDCAAICSTLKNTYLIEADFIFDDVLELSSYLAPYAGASGSGTNSVLIVKKREGERN